MLFFLKITELLFFSFTLLLLRDFLYRRISLIINLRVFLAHLSVEALLAARQESNPASTVNMEQDSARHKTASKIGSIVYDPVIAKQLHVDLSNNNGDNRTKIRIFQWTFTQDVRRIYFTEHAVQNSFSGKE
jgi:hypothetical protein